MQSDSVAKLQQTLKQKKAEDRSRFESQTRQALGAHAEQLKQLSSAELQTLQRHIEALTAQLGQQIESQTRPVQSALSEAQKKVNLLKMTAVEAWMRTALAGIALVVGLGFGTGMLMLYLSGEIRSNLETLEAQRETLATVRGLEVINSDQGRFLVHPEGSRQVQLRDGRTATRLPD